MDNEQPQRSMLEALRTVEFTMTLTRGYNVDEVDDFLEKAAVEAGALIDQVRQAGERLRQAAERIAQLEAQVLQAQSKAASDPALTRAVESVSADDSSESKESLQRTLLLAQKFVDQTKRESEAAAQNIIAQAEDRAHATLAEADERAHQLTNEAEQRLRSEVDRLDTLRTDLSTDVENLARQLEAERSRLRGSLSEVLKWVEENIQPATALMALRQRDGARGGQGSRQGGQPVASGISGSPVPVADPAQGPGAQVLDLRGVGVSNKAQPT